MRAPLRYVFLLAVVACAGDAVGPGAESLVGRWQAEVEALQPSGVLERFLVFRDNGRTERVVISRGGYPGQSGEDVSVVIVRYGHFRARGNYFVVQPDSEVTRDMFYGRSHRAVQRDFAGQPRDSSRFEVRGDELFLEFHTYPFDAPVLTQLVYSRMN